MSRVGAVLLAAGSARRMGGRNKLLLPIDGAPLLARAALPLVQGQLEPIVLVTGHEAAAVGAALAGLPIEVVYNPHHDSGMASSIGTGIAALTGRVDAALVALGDMPSVAVSTVAALCSAREARPDAILAPVHGGRRGHPVLFPARRFGELMALRGDAGARQLVSEQAELIEVGDPGIHRDIDEPADLRALTAGPRR